MKNNQLIISLFVCMLCMAAPLRFYGQYIPDTSLTYNTFLRQCQQFVQEKPNQVWVVNFWASTNSRDLYAFSGLKRVYQTFQFKPVRFISVSVDKSKRSWLAAIDRARLPWEQLFLPSLQDYNFLRKAFKHNSTPAIYIVHTSGQIQRVLDPEELQFELEQITRDLPNGPYQPERPLDVALGSDDDDPFSIPDGTSPTPTFPSDPSPTPSDQWLYHTVRKGENLFRIYKKYGVKVDELRAINNLPNDNIQVGQRLKIRRL